MLFVYLKWNLHITISTAELKNRIQLFVDKADDRVLSIVNSVFEHYYQDETVAYHPDGSPMTRKEYKMALDLSEAQIKKGDFTSVEEFEAEED